MEEPKINKPKNLKELKAIYEKFGAFLTPENKQLLAALIAEMEKGPNNADKSKLENMAREMKARAREAEEHIKNGE